MKILKFLLVFGITCVLGYFLDHKIPVGEKPIPPLGKLLNPYHGLYLNGEGKSFEDLNLKLNGLNSDVRIVYDDRKVPHIYADNLDDALFAQGYAIAADRLFQMDFSTKAVEGRLSEILGKRMLDFDKEKRRFGMAFAARNAVEGWKKHKEEYKLVEKYVEGINAYISSLKPDDYPVEHKLLGIGPDAWTVYRSALFFKSMAEVLCSNEDDVLETNSLKYFGQEQFEFLYPEINEKESPIIPKATTWDFEPLTIHESEKNNELSFYEDHRESRPPAGVGSNNWAVDGSRTKSGKPILCNDPHLSLTLPSIWYEVHIHTPKFNAYGVTLPGMPGIMIGFNENIAWGETNVGHDVLDWIKVKWTDATRTKYIVDDIVKEAILKVEEIKTREGDVIKDTIRYTDWGPIYKEDKSGDYKDLAMRWLAHDSSDKPDFMTFVNVMQCQNYDEFVEGIKVFDTPAQNFIFASREGDVALHVNGKLPAKEENDGRFIKDGSQSDAGWEQFIPREQNPHVKNPPRGFVSSANQRSADTDYPYYYTGGFEDYRGRSVNNNLSDMESVKVEDMMKLQWNSHNIMASEILPLMLDSLDDGLKKKNPELIKALSNWDHNYFKDSEAATIFEIWYRHFYRESWDEIFTQWDKVKLKKPESWRFIEIASNYPNHAFFDRLETKDRKENMTDVLNYSFEKMLSELDKIRDKKGSLEWGDYRPLNINHHLEIPAFSATGIKTDGHHSAINATNWGFGPSWRMIVSLDDQVEAWGVFPGGQSGNPSSPYYRNSVDKWSKGEYHKLNFSGNPQDLPNKLYEIQLTHD